MRTLSLLLPAAALTFLFASCGDNSNKNHGPITLGDSATIVTETEAKYLEDMVPDLRLPESNTQPVETPATPVATVDSPAATTVVEKPAEQPKPAPVANGFVVDFGEVSVTLVGVTPREGNKKFKGSNSAGLTLNGNAFAGTAITVTGGTVTRVQQRVQTGVIAQKGNVTLPLNVLGISSSAWQQLKGSNGQYTVASVSNPAFTGNVSNASIKNAVQRAAKDKRLSARDQQQWQTAVKNVRSANQTPLEVVLKSITWKVEGKDAKGKNYSKEIRLDIPQG